MLSSDNRLLDSQCARERLYSIVKSVDDRVRADEPKESVVDKFEDDST